MDLTITKTCVKCGQDFKLRDYWQFYFEPSECYDCIQLSKGHTKVTEEKSIAVWWKPWTWYKTKTVVVWTAEEARKRIAASMEKP